jgi:2-polyprenyl-3-methyl-5-hydroxy-6-metoxy-1,4-benzoquinol methylase
MNALHSKETSYLNNIIAASGFNDKRIKSSAKSAERYSKRRISKHQAEMKLIKRSVDKLSGVTTILDAPCGIGRAAIMLDKSGYSVTGVDAGQGAIIKAKNDVIASTSACEIIEADLRNLPFQQDHFDAVLCFRFFHHLLNEEAKEHLVSELCRVAGKYVMLSYLSPVSITSLKRRLRVNLGGRESSQKTTTLKEIKAYFEKHNYQLVIDQAQMPLLHTLHIATFQKN